jgi:hypothetical protein
MEEDKGAMEGEGAKEGKPGGGGPGPHGEQPEPRSQICPQAQSGF